MILDASKLLGRSVTVESWVSGLSDLDRTGLLLVSEILAARCQARGFEVRGLSLQVAALFLKDFGSPAPLAALHSEMSALNKASVAR